MKFNKTILLTIIPVVVFVLCMIFLWDISNFYMSWFDPVYAYLFNALNIAQGSFEIGHTDHPGTPLQMLIALIMRITFLFQSNKSLVDDVFTNPEHYVQISSLVFILFNALILFFLGYVVLKKTNNFKTALFLQFTPVVSLVIMYFMPVVACETLLVFGGTALVLLSFLYTYTENSYKNKWYVSWFAVISAFSFAVKISSFPLIILPLIILKGWKNKFFYFIFTVLMFFVFIIPILYKYTEHYDFLNNIFIHSERFGKGEENIIDFNMFFENLLSIFTTEFPFTIAFLGLLITGIMLLVKKRLFTGIENKHKKLIWGLLLMFLVQIIIVAKHYSFHYLIPVYTFAVLGLYAILRAFKPYYEKYTSKLNLRLWVVIGFIVLAMLTVRLVIRYSIYRGFYNPMQGTELFLKQYDSVPKIIFPLAYGAALKESALNFGLSYSGKRKSVYDTLLKLKYPDTYFFSNERGLYDWKNDVLKKDLFLKHKKIIVYAKGHDTTIINEYLKKLLDINTLDNLFKLSLLYNNRVNEEYLYELTALSEIKLELLCDLEKLNIEKNKFIDSSGNFIFDRGDFQSSDKSFSGKYSIKLTKETPFGFNIKLKVPENSSFKITMWRYAEKKNGLIVACSNDNSFYRNGAKVIEKRADGWELIELDFAVPKNIPDNEIHIYMWNNENTAIYFDDFHLQQYY
jgi:hypothetical protein